MVERIYIDGTLMEMGTGELTSLVFQSQLFTDIDGITSNRTNSVSFPATKANIKAIGLSSSGPSPSDFAYRSHTVSYWRDGVQVFTGYGTLLSVTPEEIQFTFTWGSVEAFKTLADMNLRDLRDESGDEIYITYMESILTGDKGYFPANVETGYIPHPMLSAPAVIEAMERASGVTIDSSPFEDMRIPLVTRDADDAAKIAQGVVINEGAVVKISGRGLMLAPGSNDSDIRPMYVSNGNYDVSDFDTVRLYFPAGFGITYYTLTGEGYSKVMNVAGTDDDMESWDVLWTKTMEQSEVESDSYATFSHTLTEETTVDLDVSEYSYIRIRIMAVATSYALETYFEGFTMTPDPDDDQEVLEGGQYPLFGNLPDWTCSDLLSNLMNIAGVFPLCPDSTTIEWVSCNVLYENRGSALDITDKLIVESGRMEDTVFTFGDYARKNICAYAEDETVTGSYDGEIDIDDDSLEEEGDLITLDFAATDTKNSILQIPLYTYNEDDEDYDFDEVTPRIALATGKTDDDGEEYLTFSGMDWPTLIENNYAEYADMINQPRVFTCKALLSSLDLKDLDLTVPVYARQLGHYFAIITATTEADGVTQLELLELGVYGTGTSSSSELSATTSSVGTSSSSSASYSVSYVSDLCVVGDDDGNYSAVIPSLSKTKMSALVSSGNYKLCLLRYGYARRGKFFYYTNSNGKLVSSKTSRWAEPGAYYDDDGTLMNDVGYKHVRYAKAGGTYSACRKWRVIGWEKLTRGSISSNSQTLTTMGDATLVFDLLETIVLPAATTSKLSKDGRIKNSVRTGRNKLAIALYKYVNGSWNRISNRVTVRSMINEHTQLWEFTEDNIVYDVSETE